jgi:hypothetical protein
MVFWFLLGFLLTQAGKDDTLRELSQINSSYDASDFLTSTNMSVDSPTDTTTLRSFGNALRTMFGFRASQQSGMPQSFASIISFINWFLVIILGISLYRILNPISGG